MLPSAPESGTGQGPDTRPATILSAALAAFIGLLLLTFVLSQVGSEDRQDIDFVIYRDAVAHLISDDVYEYLFESLPFAYPPSALIALSPTAVAPEALARAVWFLIAVAAVLLTLRLIAREAAPRSWWASWPATLLLTAGASLTFPIQNCLVIGQVSCLLMGTVSLATLGRDRATDGLLVGLATSIKLTPGLFAVWWWLVGRRREAILAALTTLAVFGAGWLAMPESSRFYFVRGGMLDLDRNAPADGVGNQSVLGVIARLGLDPYPQAAVWLAVVMTLTLWALCTSARLERMGLRAIAVPLVGCWSALAAPLSWVHAFVWLPPLALAVGLSRDRLGGTASWLAGMLVVVSIAPIFLVAGLSAGFEPLAGVVYPSAVLACTAWLWRRTHQSAQALSSAV